jgi:hypothetical protein
MTHDSAKADAKMRHLNGSVERWKKGAKNVLRLEKNILKKIEI